MKEEDPDLFEELSLKKKWSSIAKDPSKYLKEPINGTWNIINHLP